MKVKSISANGQIDSATFANFDFDLNFSVAANWSDIRGVVPMTELAKKITSIAVKYLGPAVSVFVERQTKIHLRDIQVRDRGKGTSTQFSVLGTVFSWDIDR